MALLRYQGPGLIGKRLERTEAVAVGAEQVSENEGIAGITLPLGGGVTRARGFPSGRMTASTARLASSCRSGARAAVVTPAN